MPRNKIRYYVDSKAQTICCMELREDIFFLGYFAKIDQKQIGSNTNSTHTEIINHP